MTAHGSRRSPAGRPGARPRAGRGALAAHPDRSSWSRCCVVAPFVIYPVFLMKMLCFALFACAFNLLIGYVGLLSFGHALFFGGAGYLAAHAAKVWGLPFELAVLTGMATAALLGLAVGWLAIRRQGIYFAMITLALAQMFYFYCLRATIHRRRGRDPGRPPRKAPRAPLAGRQPDDVLRRPGDLPLRLLLHPPGRPLAVRAGTQGGAGERAPGGVAGLQVGPLQAHRLRALGGDLRARRRRPSPSSSSWPRSPTCTGRTSGEVILMVLLGGLGTVFGPIVGAVVIIVRGELPCPARGLGDGGPGRALRGVRARLPPGNHRRAVARAAPSAVSRS